MFDKQHEVIVDHTRPMHVRVAACAELDELMGVDCDPPNESDVQSYCEEAGVDYRTGEEL